MAVHEVEQLQQPLKRIEMLDVETQLPGAQSAERIFEHGDVERRLAAEVVIEHARVRARILDDPGDSCAGETVTRELRGRGLHDPLARLRLVLARPADRRRALFRADRSFEISHGAHHP